ncbi:MAG TPA: ATP-grasp domain-containing protein [Ktedonobacteraceae bacterium]
MQAIIFLESNGEPGAGMQAILVARTLGYTPIFLTRDFTHYQHIPGVAEIFKDCEIAVCETNNVEQVYTKVAAIQKSRPVAALLTMSEYYVAIAAQVAHRLGLRCLHPAAAAIAKNKWLTRKRLGQAGISALRYARVETLPEAHLAAEQAGFPCVLKPVDGTSSVGVTLCWEQAEVAAHFQRLQAITTNSRMQKRDPALLVEAYISGYEVSVETLTWAGQHHVIGVTDKVVSAPPYFVELAHTFPSCHADEIVATCAATATAALDAIGFDFGAAHTEIRMAASGPSIIEINARVGGDHIIELIHRASGISLVREIVRLYLGEAPDLAPRAHRGAAIHFIVAPPGLVRRTRQIKPQQRHAEIDICFCVQAGDSIAALQSNRQRVGYAIATAATPYTASCLARISAEHQVIVSEPAPKQGNRDTAENHQQRKDDPCSAPSESYS